MPTETETATLPQPVADVLAALNALSPEHRAAFADAVGDETPEGLKPLRSKFFAAGKDEVKGKDLKAARAEVQRLTGELDTLRAEAGKQPDLEKRDKAWQDRLDAKERELLDARAQVQQVRTETRQEKLENALLAQKLRPKYARLVVRDYVQRLHEREDGTLELVDEAGIPVKVPEGKTVFQAAAEMARKEADPEDVLSNADGGAGITNGAGGGGVQGKSRAQQEQEKRAEIGALL